MWHSYSSSFHFITFRRKNSFLLSLEQRKALNLAWSAFKVLSRKNSEQTEALAAFLLLKFFQNEENVFVERVESIAKKCKIRRRTRDAVTLLYEM